MLESSPPDTLSKKFHFLVSLFGRAEKFEAELFLKKFFDPRNLQQNFSLKNSSVGGLTVKVSHLKDFENGDRKVKYTLE